MKIKNARLEIAKICFSKNCKVLHRRSHPTGPYWQSISIETEHGILDVFVQNYCMGIRKGRPKYISVNLNGNKVQRSQVFELLKKLK